MFTVPLFNDDYTLNVVPVALYYFALLPVLIAAVTGVITYLIANKRTPAPKPVRTACIVLETVFAAAWVLMAVVALCAASVSDGSFLRMTYAAYLTNHLWWVYIIPGIAAGIYLGAAKNRS